MVGNWPTTSKNFLVRTCDPSIVPLAAPFNGFCGLKLLTLFASGVLVSRVAVSDLEEGGEVAVFQERLVRLRRHCGLILSQLQPEKGELHSAQLELKLQTEVD